MPDFIDCKYEENLINRLEQITGELNFLPLGDQSEEDTIILNFNTRVLNRQIRNYKNIQNGIAKTKTITPSVKRRFAERIIPQKLSTEFARTRINKVGDVVDFVDENRQLFPNTTEETVLETLKEIRPSSFRSFGSLFPSTNKRLLSGTISSAETKTFITQNGFDPRLFANNVKTNTFDILNLLEGFLSSLGIGSSIMGSVCSLLEDIFAPVKAQRDLSGPSSEFLQNYQNVLGLINPNVGEVLGNVQELISLMQKAQENSVNIISDLQSAFSLLASAFGIIMQFKDVLSAVMGNGDTQAESSLSINWNFELIRNAIEAEDNRFQAILQSTNKPLGDINQDGVMDDDDANALQTYIDNTATTDVESYVNNIFIPHLNANSSAFSDFIDFPSAQEPNSKVGDIAENLSSVTNNLGAGPGAGDFGLSKILEIISTASGLLSSIQALVGGLKPVDIQSLFEQLDQIVDLGSEAVEDIFRDFAENEDEYREIVEDALEEAEEVAVDDKPKAKEISDKHKESLEEPFTDALELSAEAPKLLQTDLIDLVRSIKNGIRGIAAVGVLDQTADQLLSVVDQAAANLKSKAEMFSPETLNNGYHFNMQSSYARMAGLIAIAKNAASDAATEEMKDSLKGMIAQSSEKFRQKNKEEVEYVALRFCKMAGEIERIYEDATKPIEEMVNNFQAANRLLAGTGNNTTLRAVRAGAIRYDTQTRLAAMQQAGTIDATITSPFINAAGQRSIDPGAGISVGVLPPLPSDYQFPTFEESLAGTREVKYAPLTPGTARAITGPAGFLIKPYGGVDGDSMRKLFALARAWGRQIQINSAYRNPQANRSVGGARNSYHMAGKAFDCGNISSRSDQIRFMNLAYQAGFTGLISYNSFVHVDTRGYNYSGGRFNYYSLRGPNGGKTG